MMEVKGLGLGLGLELGFNLGFSLGLGCCSKLMMSLGGCKESCLLGVNDGARNLGCRRHQEEPG